MDCRLFWFRSVTTRDRLLTRGWAGSHPAKPLPGRRNTASSPSVRFLLLIGDSRTAVLKGGTSKL